MGAKMPPRSRRQLLRDWDGARSQMCIHRPAMSSTQINMGKDLLGSFDFGCSECLDL